MWKLLLWSYVVWILRNIKKTITSEWKREQFWWKLNDNNYKIIIKKLNCDCWDNSYFASTDVTMLVHECGMS